MSTSALTGTTSSTTATTTAATNTTNTTNPYDINSLYSTSSMANDYFGSQVFGNGIGSTGITAAACTQGNVNTTAGAAAQTTGTTIQDIYGQPDNIASALLQSYMASTDPNYAQTNTAATTTATTAAANTSTAAAAPTMQDYIIATQVANQFANAAPLTSTSTAYTSNDYFAQQAFGTQNLNNNQTNSQTANINYAA